jgi:cadmium resistance protein CadD (predicted permease)
VAKQGLLAVAAIHVVSGADNVSVYTPVFAASDAGAIALYGAVFAVLTGLWCYAALWIVNHRFLGAPVRRYAPRFLPLVLIGIGLFVLFSA